jgi:ribose transport system permease protein
VFAVWIPGIFLTTGTLNSILYENSTSAILAIGVIAPFAVGAFDLSVGANLGFASVVLGGLVTQHNWPWPAGVAATLVVGAGVGVCNALLVIWARIDSIIATLATMSVLTGAALAVGNNAVYINFPAGFDALGVDTFLGISFPVWCVIVVALVASYVLDRTSLGRSVYATGGGAEAARLSGVRTQRCVFWALVASGAVAALAGVVLTARLGSSEADLGPPYLLPAFAAVFLGATQFKNGRFNVWGAVLATYTLATIETGLIEAGGPVWLPDVFNGVALALAVALTVRRRRIRTAGRPVVQADRPSEAG